MQGTWTIPSIDGAEVRLRSGRIGLMSIDATAPVRAGTLTIDAGAVHFSLTLALEQVRTRNFLMQSAARTLITSHGVHDLVYSGTGAEGAAIEVMGTAIAGNINVTLGLRITPIGQGADPMGEIELVGSANLGTVHLPLPGLGTVDDFSFDVDARLRTGSQ